MSRDEICGPNLNQPFPSPLPTCWWGLVQQSWDLADEGQVRRNRRTIFLASPSCCLLQQQQFFLWILRTAHTASGLCTGPQCNVGTLEGAAALPSEEHPAICNGSPGAEAPKPLDLWTGSPWVSRSYIRSLQF